MAADTTGKKKFAFRDVRDDVELLASGRPPKSLRFNKAQAASKKLAKLQNKVKSATSKVLKSQVLGGATMMLLGAAASAFAAKIAGKVRLPGMGKLGGALSKVQSMAQAATVGVVIAEELDPRKIRRPLKEGLSASASVAAKTLAETVAASVAQSLVSGAPLGSGLPTLPRGFKTAASLVKSPRFFNPTKEVFSLDAEEQATADGAITHVVISTPEVRLYPQRGLLEDELMHRLTLLAENVYAPTNQYAIAQGYGSIKILEGFRAETSGTSPHETGEALDITLGDGSLGNSERCFALAQWMRHHILYDQLILCFDISGNGQVWIHASFRADARRRQVMTKAFDDTHKDGLHLYQFTPATSESTTQATNGAAFIAMLGDRQSRLEPVGLNTPTPQESAASGLSGNITSEDAECSFVPRPPGGGGDGQYAWEVPAGINISTEYLTEVIAADVIAITGKDPRIESFVLCKDPFVLSYWVTKAQIPDKFSDGQWRVGWNGYWRSRIANAHATCETAIGDTSAAGTDGIIAEASGWPCHESTPNPQP